MKTKQSKRKKTKTKHRKPKYLSLSLQLTATTPQPPMPTTVDHHDQKQQLINLFPLHPENLMEQDKLDMASIFSSCDNDEANTTLTGILSSNNDEDDVNNTNNQSPSSVNYADEEVQLVRTAMRRKNFKTERNDDDYHDDINEKWVYYSEVVEKKGVIKGLSSSSSSNTTTTTTTSYYHNNRNYDHHINDHEHNRSKLVLKLDYEKIMKSWVNKGPLYILDLDAPQPQTVPELQDDDFFLPSSINGTIFDERDNGGSWTVPEMKHIENNVTGKRDDESQAAGLSAAMHNREASVQRYKEKRRNRLFTKTIRYEVRKLNAEKRPRIKGRFVKRN